MKKTALITGATSGIGEACARKFAEGGYNVIITGRRSERLEALKAELEETGAKVKTLTFDVRDADAAGKAIGSLGEEWSTIDVLVNNAGLALGLDKEHEGSMEDWNTMIDTNIKGLLTMTRLIVPGMVGKIADTSSTSEALQEMQPMPEAMYIALPRPQSRPSRTA